MSVFQKALFSFILLLGIAARFVALDRIPEAVHPDEAMNGNEGYYAVTHSDPKLFYSANQGREGLYVNLVGLSVWAFGHNQFGLRLWSTVLGSAAVFLIFAVGRELYSSSVGLWASFFLATSFWHINFSRIAFRAILVPTLLLAAFYGLLRAWRTGRGSWALAGGVAFGLGFHSYIAFRIAPLVALALIGLESTRRKGWVRNTALWIVAAFAVALPIGIHFLHQPEDFTSRTSQLSIFSQPGAAQILAVAFVKSALMFLWRGDCNGWHNLACEPELPPFLAVLLLIGGAITLAGILSVTRRRESAFLLSWTILMMLPAVLAWEGGPHALRAIGTTPPIFLMTALGADAVFQRLKARAILRSAFLILVLGSGFYELYRYFGEWAHSQAARERSKHQITSISEYLNSLPPETPRYVIVNDYGELDPIDPSDPNKQVYTPAQTVIFLTHGHATVHYVLVEEMFDLVFPPGSVIAPLAIDSRIFAALRERGLTITEEDHEEFAVARVQ